MAAPRIRIYRDEPATRNAPPAEDPLVSLAVSRPWHGIFGNDRPVDVEIGCGSGRFLVAAATTQPDRNFFGIERSAGLAARARAAIAAAGLPNASVLCGDARCVVMHLIPPLAVGAYHIYFPDPWWKRRHHKRRVHDRDFAAAVARTLAPDGQVYVATDVEELLAALTRRFTDAGLRHVATAPADVHTVFAERCQQEDRPLWRATFAHRR